MTSRVISATEKEPGCRTISRLRASARRITSLTREYAEANSERVKSWTNFSLPDEMFTHESKIICQASEMHKAA
jgi:hypothetical protein